MRLLRLLACCALTLLVALFTFAQGTSGQLTGSVTTGGSPLPGVTVTVASPSLQGTRSTVTGDAGAYNIPALPPGMYDVVFDLSGMQRLTRRVRVELAQTARTDADLRVSAVAESVTITASAPSVLETPTAATNFDAREIDSLPLTRTITDTVLLAPGVTDAGPNDQIMISGAQSFDSLFLVNGVVVNESLRGQPQDLFIEDAIQETTILRGAISAEYGRFTGGVVTTVTKSGGNEFSGSLRDTLNNDDWTAKTPFAGQAQPLDKTNHTLEGTLGGRIVRDRLWFFVAGRKEGRDSASQTVATNVPFAQEDKRDRYEAKLTANLFSKHDLSGSYIKSNRTRTGFVSGRIVDLASLTTRKDPNSLLSLHYNGVLTSNLLAEAQFSRMNFSFTQGAETHDPIAGTIIFDAATNRRGYSPTFCGEICGPKQRDNKSMLLKGSYFLSTHSLGNHSMSAGYEDFHQLRNENNFQSGSDFRIHGIFYYDGPRVYFGIDPEKAADQQIEWDPVPALSQTSDFGVKSVFINDKWDLSQRWAFNLGGRYDKASGSDQAGNKTVDDSAFSPRLSATFDPTASGRHRITASYSRYVSKVDQGPADNTAAAGRYASYYWDYHGPTINPAGTPFSQMVPIDQVIKQVFAWFNSVGGTRNTEFLASSHVPGITTKFEKSLVAPHMDEVQLSYGMTLGSGGYVRADAMHRNWKDFYVIRRTRDTGIATDANGTKFDIGIIENSSDKLSRKYDALQLEAAYRLFNMLNVGGNYTYAKLKGNVEGEAASFATTLTDYKNYPEYTGFEQYAPEGYLLGDMRHRANAWVGIAPRLGFGDLSVSVLERYHSGLPYSAIGTIDVRKSTALPTGVVNPGYIRPPSNVSYFFSDRGQYRTDSIFSTDLALRYTLPISKLGLTFLADIINVFNDASIEDPDFVVTTTRTARQLSRLKVFNPATETPVEGVNFERDPKFGTATSNNAYQQPRMYRFGVRLRF